MSINITFIGLGIMGTEMAKNLIAEGATVTVYNRTSSASDPFEGVAHKVAWSLLEAVKDADLVLTMLSNPEAVSAVMLAPAGGLQHMKVGSLWADCSTVNPSFSKQAAKAAEQASIRFIDAPVAGSKPQAASKELIFFVGGAGKDVEEAKPFFDSMGKKVVHVGPTGHGASLKMLVNIMLAQSMVIFSEAILLGEKMGLDSNFLLDLLPNTAVAAPFTKFKAESIRHDNYEVMFPLELMHKDLHLARQTAYEHQQSLFLAGVTEDIYARAKAAGMGRLDFAAVHRVLADH